ncbi:MAG: zinc-dependent metalloprotease [bacterium]
MRSRFPVGPSLALALLLLAAPVLAADAKNPGPSGRPGGGKGGPPSGAPAAAAPRDKPVGDWSKVTKDAERKKGFVTLWRKRDNLWLEIGREQLNQPFLYIVSLSRGIGSNYTLGGLPLDDRMLQWERHGDRIMLVQVNTQFTTPAGTPIDKARENSIPNSIVQSFKIEAEHDSTKAVLVDLGALVLSDVTDLSEQMKGALGGVGVRFDKERSILNGSKTFPDNAEVEVTLTYSPLDRSRLMLESVPDNRYIPVGVHYSFTRLPATPMARRWADNRVGYFLTATKDFARDDQENFWLRHIHRWRLEKKDTTAALSEPVKPIVYYIDWTVPDKFRPWVKRGVEKWQAAFEEAGFKNAIVAMDPPKDDADWDPEDARYSTIRWITSHEPSFGAIGPSRVDPRTGEILDSDILFEASMFQSYANSYRRFAGPDEIAQSALPWTALDHLPANTRLDHLCMAGDALTTAGSIQRIAMLMDGTLAPGSPVPDEFLQAAVEWATLHEVGHALGLRHNFRSSTSTPYEQLHDTTFTRSKGLYSSVMEYPSPNIDYTRKQQGDWYTWNAGSYDKWAIRYGYTPSGTTNPDEDRAFARRIADESLAPGHEYSTDEDTYGADSPDPRSNIYDLGSDPLRFARERTTYLSKLWRDPAFEARLVGGSGDLTALRRAMDTMAQQYATAAGMAVKYVGGSYMSRIERGQPNEKDPVEPVPAAKQREAVDFLSRSVWATDAMSAPGSLLRRLAPNRWSHWGQGMGVFAGRQDYGWNDRVLAVQGSLLNAVTAPALLARLREQETRSSDAYRLSEHFDKLTRSVWGEVGSANPAAIRTLEGPHTRRELQRAFVDRMANMVADPPADAPDEARALARLALTRVDARCARALAAGTTMGDNTRAHLLETRARIKRALEAGRDVDGAPAPARMGRMGATSAAPD